MEEAKQERMTRRGAERQSSSMRGTMARSDGVKPGRSTLVESLKSARTPSAAVAGEGVEIEGSAVDRSLIDLEVAGVND